MANIINVTVSDQNEVVNVTLSDGIFNISGSGTFIDDFAVVKGAGNVAPTIEVGDKIWGFIGNVFVAGLVTTIPVNDVSDLNLAVQGEYIV